MKINIICGDKGWIYDQFVNAFRKYSKHEIVLNDKNSCDIVHFVPYYEEKKINGIKTAWFSHCEQRKDLKNKFISAAKNVDFCFSHSKKYMDFLMGEHGIKDIIQIMPGVDLGRFILRPEKKEGNKKLAVGFVGRHYTSSNRKNPQLLDKISKLKFVDFRMTGGKVKAEDMPKFYRSLDVVVSPAINEGGPLSIQEALACGVPFLCYDGVGVANEFDFGVLRVPFGNEEKFLKKLLTFWKNQGYIKYGNSENMKKMRDQVIDFTWENFVQQHDDVWENLRNYNEI